MNRKKPPLGILLLVIATTAVYHPVMAEGISSAQPLYYVVRPGDTIGEVLNELGVCPLWVKNKNVEVSLKLNQLPNDSAARLLPVGTKIKLPVSHLTIPDSEYRIEQRSIVRTINEPRAYCKKGFVAPPQFLQAEKPVIPPVSHPVAEIGRTPSEEDRAVSSIGLNLNFSYFAIHSIDLTSNASSTMLSKLSPAFDLYWKLEWNDFFQTFAKINYQKYSITPFNDFKTIQNLDGSKTSLTFDTRYRLAEKFNLLAGIGSKEELFNRSATSSTVTVETVPLFFASLGIDYRWLRYRGIELNQDLSYMLFAGRQTAFYRIDGGTAYATSMTLCHFIDSTERKKIFLNFGLRKHSQNTDIITNSDDEIHYSIGYELGL
jgi:hypothetical protein